MFLDFYRLFSVPSFTVSFFKFSLLIPATNTVLASFITMDYKTTLYNCSAASKFPNSFQIYVCVCVCHRTTNFEIPMLVAPRISIAHQKLGRLQNRTFVCELLLSTLLSNALFICLPSCVCVFFGKCCLKQKPTVDFNNPKKGRETAPCNKRESHRCI